MDTITDTKPNIATIVRRTSKGLYWYIRNCVDWAYVTSLAASIVVGLTAFIMSYYLMLSTAAPAIVAVFCSLFFGATAGVTTYAILILLVTIVSSVRRFFKRMYANGLAQEQKENSNE